MKNLPIPLLLLCFTAQAQTFTILPSATTKITAPTGWTGQTTTYNASDKSFSAPGGIWLPDVYSLKGGLYLEADLLVTKANQKVAGCILTKAGTAAIGLNCGKVKLDWISGYAEQVNGSDTIPINTWTKICIGIDTVGRIIATLRGISDINRITVFHGSIPQTGDKWTFLQNFPGRCRSIRVWCDSKPPISPTGFDCYASCTKENLKFRFARVDRSQTGQLLSIIQENPNGAQTTLYTGKLTPGELSFNWANYMNGSWSFKIATAKCEVRQTLMKGAQPFMPGEFVTGLYSVNAADYRLMKDLGFNTVYSDFPITNNPPNYKQMAAYLDSAKKYGLRSMVRMGLQASKGNLEFTQKPDFWYPQDEAAGDLDGLNRNYWACKALYPDVPVIGNFNNFSRIEEAQCDILGVNVYSSGRVVYDVTRRAVQLKPVFVTLPQYETPDGRIFYTQAQMMNLTAQAIVGGAIGVLWFTWDDQVKSKPGRYYTAKFPDKVQNLKQCNMVANNTPLSWQPVETDNPNVAACFRGEELWIVNLTDRAQSATVQGRFVTLGGLEFTIK